MSKIIAIAGKGGVGKTSIAGLFIRFLVRQKIGSVLAVDADPNSNLGQALGISPGQDVGAILEDISKNIEQVPVNMSKEEFISYRIQTTLDEARGFDLLTMGRPEGPGCYCYINNVLRQTLTKLMKSYDFIVMDNEAGFEHLSRKTLKEMDVLVMVSDNTQAGLQAAKRIFGLIEELNIKYKQIFLIINRIRKSVEPKLDFPLADIAGLISEDETFRDAGINIMALDEDSKIIKETDKIFLKIMERSNEAQTYGTTKRSEHKFAG